MVGRDGQPWKRLGQGLGEKMRPELGWGCEAGEGGCGRDFKGSGWFGKEGGRQGSPARLRRQTRGIWVAALWTDVPRRPVWC